MISITDVSFNLAVPSFFYEILYLLRVRNTLFLVLYLQVGTYSFSEKKKSQMRL